MHARIPCGLLALLAVAACASHKDESPRPPMRSCGLTVWHQPSSAAANVEIVGAWNGWARPGRMLPADRTDGWRVTSFDLPPGEHAYAIVEDGEWLIDRHVPTTALHDDHEVTWVNLGSCDAPSLRIEGVQIAAGAGAREATIDASFLASRFGDALDPGSISATTADGHALELRAGDAQTGLLTLGTKGLAPGKHRVTLNARDVQGRAAEETTATVWVEDRPFELRDAVIYQVVVDRYRSEAGALSAPQLTSGRAGGNIKGVRNALESGEIGALGVNMIWLSPLYENPTGMFPGADGRPYTSYHGYWPTNSRALDPAVSTEEDLDALVRAAHARGIRVIFDVVPNHVHSQHPYVAAHMKDAWFGSSDGSCVCGRDKCDWGSHIQDCWFTPYLPDLDWKNPAVANQITSDVRWWIDRFDGDGLRIDAVPMMPRAAARRIAHAVRARYEHPGSKMMLLGENFTGPGGYGQLRYDLGPHGLDGEFHFPLMWSLRRAIADESGPLAAITETLEEGERAWAGSGAVMGSMIGNHDVSRFASESAGDAQGDGWVGAQQPTSRLVYQKQQMALGVVYTVPGVPVLYYGDEVGLAGRSDPDSRRVMPPETSLSPDQLRTREVTRLLGRARACSESLRRGTFRSLYAGPEHVVYAREAPGADPAIVVVTRNPTKAVSVPLPGIPSGNYIDVLGGGQTSLSPELTKLDRAPFSLELFFPSASACAQAQRAPN